MAAPSLAERLRAHGEAFTLALELGITPRAAEAVIRDRQARLRWLAGEQRRALRHAPSTSSVSAQGDRGSRGHSERDSQPWMMRE